MAHRLLALGATLGVLWTAVATGAERGQPHTIMNACAGTSTPSYWIEKLKAEDPHTRATAARALGESRQGEVVPALLQALNDTDREVRLAVVRALGRIGPQAKGAGSLKQIGE